MTDTGEDELAVLKDVREALDYVDSQVIKSPETIRNYMETGEYALQHNLKLLQGKVRPSLEKLTTLIEKREQS